MELYLQFGFGMMDHSRTLLSEWGGGTVILSPRDLKDGQLDRLAAAINRIPDGAVMLDPQFYLPHADHSRLVSHAYWPSGYTTGAFFAGPQLAQLLYNLKLLNNRLETSEVILPGLLAAEINDDWLAIQRMILEEARAADFDRPLCQTVAISADACRIEAQVAKLLEHAAKFPADSYYLVCEHPKGAYLVDDATWLANVLDITAGLKLNGSRVVIGYCTHQMLIAGTAKADAIASGNWMNVRSFPPEKFRASYEEEIKHRSVWYYCPQALSEYKLPFLDIARTVGLLNLLAPAVRDSRVEALFSGGQPSAIGLPEQNAFRYYLCSLKRQVDETVKDTFDDTVAQHEVLLSAAETLLRTLSGSKISGQLRDFSDIVAVNRAALASISVTRGSLLRRRWSTL